LAAALRDWPGARVILMTALVAMGLVACAGVSSPQQSPKDVVSESSATAPSPTPDAPSATPSRPAATASPSPSVTTGLAKDVLAKCPRKSATKTPVKFQETAAEGQFSERLLRAPACTPIEITFTNYGAVIGVHHNIAISLGEGQWLFRGTRALTTDPITYKIPPLPPGNCRFLSEPRTSLNGILEVTDQP